MKEGAFIKDPASRSRFAGLGTSPAECIERGFFTAAEFEEAGGKAKAEKAAGAGTGGKRSAGDAGLGAGAGAGQRARKERGPPEAAQVADLARAHGGDARVVLELLQKKVHVGRLLITHTVGPSLLHALPSQLRIYQRTVRRVPHVMPAPARTTSLRPPALPPAPCRSGHGRCPRVWACALPATAAPDVARQEGL